MEGIFTLWDHGDAYVLHSQLNIIRAVFAPIPCQGMEVSPFCIVFVTIYPSWAWTTMLRYGIGSNHPAKPRPSYMAQGQRRVKSKVKNNYLHFEAHSLRIGRDTLQMKTKIWLNCKFAPVQKWRKTDHDYYSLTWQIRIYNYPIVNEIIIYIYLKNLKFIFIICWHELR